MAKRAGRRDEWHKANSKWTRSLGHRGIRVRLFQKRENGTFYRSVWRAGQGYERACLHTTDRVEADRLGKELLARLLQTTDDYSPPAEITLGELRKHYCLENESFLDNKPLTRQTETARMDMLCSFFGENRKILLLLPRDQATYAAKRLLGGIKVQKDGETFVSEPCRIRSVESDLAILHRMLRWATTVRLPNGRPWLDHNPLDGVRRTREKNPKRPVATWDRSKLFAPRFRSCVVLQAMKLLVSDG
jgi:hypothetical protein